MTDLQALLDSAASAVRHEALSPMCALLERAAAADDASDGEGRDACLRAALTLAKVRRLADELECPSPRLHQPAARRKSA